MSLKRLLVVVFVNLLLVWAVKSPPYANSVILFNFFLMLYFLFCRGRADLEEACRREEEISGQLKQVKESLSLAEAKWRDVLELDEDHKKVHQWLVQHIEVSLGLVWLINNVIGRNCEERASVFEIVAKVQKTRKAIAEIKELNQRLERYEDMTLPISGSSRNMVQIEQLLNTVESSL